MPKHIFFLFYSILFLFFFYSILFLFLLLDSIELSSCIRIGELNGLGFHTGVFSSEIKTFHKIEQKWFYSIHEMVKSLIYFSNA